MFISIFLTESKKVGLLVQRVNVCISFQHFIMRNLKHLAHLKEFYSEHLTLNLLPTCHLMVVAFVYYPFTQSV